MVSSHFTRPMTTEKLKASLGKASLAKSQGHITLSSEESHEESY